MISDPVTAQPVSRVWRSAEVMLLLLALTSPMYANGPSAANEYELKAAFIYNLMTFVEWPGSAKPDQLDVCVAGEGPLAPALSTYLSGKHTGQRSIRVSEVHSRSEMRNCDLLVVAYPDRGRVREVLAQLQGSSVLSVGDGDAFAESGGVIAFVARDSRLQLAVNPRAAERAKIHFSSKLLSIARIVSDGDAAR